MRKGVTFGFGIKKTKRWYLACGIETLESAVSASVIVVVAGGSTTVSTIPSTLGRVVLVQIFVTITITDIFSYRTAGVVVADIRRVDQW